MTQLRNFDAAAVNWDEKPRRVKLAEEISTAIAAAFPLSKEWEVLDFGCGTGLVTLKLAPKVRNVTGIDSSPGMIEQLKAKIEQSGFSNVRAELCDLGKGELPTGKYHLITSSMTLHHIAEIVPLLHTLKTLLHPGGWIALADLESEGGRFHEDPTGVFHTGFSSEDFIKMLDMAGFSSVSTTIAATIVKEDLSFPVLLATAQSAKP